MVYVSLVEIFFKARVSLSQTFTEKQSYGLAVVAFFAGIAVLALIDRLIPSYENPHEMKNVHDLEQDKEPQKKKLMRMGLFLHWQSGSIHFPEGLATFMKLPSAQSQNWGSASLITIAIHNIPEGLSSLSPHILCHPKPEGKLFSYHSHPVWLNQSEHWSGYFLLRSFFNEMTAGLVFAGVAWHHGGYI